MFNCFIYCVSTCHSRDTPPVLCGCHNITSNHCFSHTLAVSALLMYSQLWCDERLTTPRPLLVIKHVIKCYILRMQWSLFRSFHPQCQCLASVWLMLEPCSTLNHSNKQRQRGRLTPRCWGKSILSPRNNMPCLLVGYKQFCIAGLQESWSEEPVITLQNSWRPGLRHGPHWGADAAPRPHSWCVEHLPQYRPSPRTLPRLSASDFKLALTPQCWFRCDAIAIKQRIALYCVT